jgi:hypothetical protein
MKHIKKFNEGFTSATMLGGPSQIGNTGQSTSYTGPVSFQATNNVPGYIPPKGGAQEPVTYDDKLPDWPRAKLQNSLKNDMQGKKRRNVEDDLFGKSKRRKDKLLKALKPKSKDIFIKDKESEHKPKRNIIKKFSEFNKKN